MDEGVSKRKTGPKILNTKEREKKKEIGCLLRISWKDDADLVLWQWGLALSIRCLALALTFIAPHRGATRGGRHARHRADLGNLGLLGSAGQEGNHSHLSCRAEGREPEHTREGRKHLEIWMCR